MKYTLVIKGDLATVHNVCTERGIVTEEVHRHPEFNECIVRTAPNTSPVPLTEWFVEDHGPAPFPDGTLLWYGPAT